MRPVQIPCRFFRQVIDSTYLCRTCIDDIKILCCLFIYIYDIVVILSESDDTHRQIYTDGRGFPKEFAQPAWLGYSIGHWERDTLVVETIGFNDKTRFDGIGHPHSEALRVTERYRRSDFGHMDVEMTFDDPKMYTKPFTIKVPYELQADSDIFESFCNENEKDRSHFVQK